VLGAGDIAPDFSLPDETGRAVTLDELLAQGPLVLFFYPADFTPVCTREACLIRDAYAELAAAGVSVAGVSTDDSATHARFRERHALPYPLLADSDKHVIKAFGVSGPAGFGTRRATFLIDADKTIREAVRADLRLGPHDKLIRRALRAATES
jgi:peroxiredoxin Q/BCP